MYANEACVMYPQHPQIQKESQYIKYLCCEDKSTMNLWVTGIRIAKVNKVRQDSSSAASLLYSSHTLFLWGNEMNKSDLFLIVSQ